MFKKNSNPELKIKLKFQNSPYQADGQVMAGGQPPAPTPADELRVPTVNLDK